MASTIEQIMKGIEARLATISGLRTAEYIADQINPPQAVVGVPDIPEYHSTFGRGVYRLEPTVTVLVSKAIDRVGQLKLASYMNPDGPTSIPAAIKADRTLGGLVDQCYVTAFRTIGVEEVGAIGYFGGVFSLQVMAKGK